MSNTSVVQVHLAPESNTWTVKKNRGRLFAVATTICGLNDPT